MTDREQLLDELGKCFARAAVDAWLAESGMGEKGPADARQLRDLQSSNDLRIGSRLCNADVTPGCPGR